MAWSAPCGPPVRLPHDGVRRSDGALLLLVLLLLLPLLPLGTSASDRLGPRGGPLDQLGFEAAIPVRQPRGNLTGSPDLPVWRVGDAWAWSARSRVLVQVASVQLPALKDATVRREVSAVVRTGEGWLAYEVAYDERYGLTEDTYPDIESYRVNGSKTGVERYRAEDLAFLGGEYVEVSAGELVTTGATEPIVFTSRLAHAVAVAAPAELYDFPLIPGDRWSAPYAFVYTVKGYLDSPQVGNSSIDIRSSVRGNLSGRVNGTGLVSTGLGTYQATEVLMEGGWVMEDEDLVTGQSATVEGFESRSIRYAEGLGPLRLETETSPLPRAVLEWERCEMVEGEAAPPGTLSVEPWRARIGEAVSAHWDGPGRLESTGWGVSLDAPGTFSAPDGADPTPTRSERGSYGLLVVSGEGPSLSVADAATLVVWDPPAYDLAVGVGDIVVDPPVPTTSEPAAISVTLRQLGEAEVVSARVCVLADGLAVGDFHVGIPGEGATEATVPWTPSRSGDTIIEVVVDPEDALPEENEGNNRASVTVSVAGENLHPRIVARDPIEDRIEVLAGAIRAFHVEGEDPEGEPVSYAWTVEGRSGNITGQDLLLDTHGFAVGDYDVTARVGDGFAWTLVAWKVVIMDPSGNRPPTIDSVSPASPVEVEEGAQLLLSATFSDANGDPVSAEWYVDGMWVAGEEGGGGSSFTYRPARFDRGLHVICLTASSSDWVGGTYKDRQEWEIRVTYIPRPPVAVISSPSPGQAFRLGDRVELNATASYDPNGESIVQALWESDIDGCLASGLEGDFVPSFGQHRLALTLEDETGAVSVSTLSISVGPPNRPPVADAGFPVLAVMGEAAELNASASVDPDGDALTFLWDLGDGTAAEGPLVRHVYPSVGTYRAEVTVFDGRASVSSSVSVTVRPAIPAIMVVVVPPEKIVAGFPARFDAGQSSDPLGYPLTFLWSFGDGTYGEGPSVDHVYARHGVYEVGLTVLSAKTSASWRGEAVVTPYRDVELGFIRWAGSLALLRIANTGSVPVEAALTVLPADAGYPIDPVVKLEPGEAREVWVRANRTDDVRVRADVGLGVSRIVSFPPREGPLSTGSDLGDGPSEVWWCLLPASAALAAAIAAMVLGGAGRAGARGGPRGRAASADGSASPVSSQSASSCARPPGPPGAGPEAGAELPAAGGKGPGADAGSPTPAPLTHSSEADALLSSEPPAAVPSFGGRCAERAFSMRGPSGPSSRPDADGPSSPGGGASLPSPPSAIGHAVSTKHTWDEWGSWDDQISVGTAPPSGGRGGVSGHEPGPRRGRSKRGPRRRSAPRLGAWLLLAGLLIGLAASGSGPLGVGSPPDHDPVSADARGPPSTPLGGEGVTAASAAKGGPATGPPGSPPAVATDVGGGPQARGHVKEANASAGPWSWIEDERWVYRVDGEVWIYVATDQSWFPVRENASVVYVVEEEVDPARPGCYRVGVRKVYSLVQRSPTEHLDDWVMSGVAEGDAWYNWTTLALEGWSVHDTGSGNATVTPLIGHLEFTQDLWKNGTATPGSGGWGALGPGTYGGYVNRTELTEGLTWDSATGTKTVDCASYTDLYLNVTVAPMAGSDHGFTGLEAWETGSWSHRDDNRVGNDAAYNGSGPPGGSGPSGVRSVWNESAHREALVEIERRPEGRHAFIAWENWVLVDHYVGGNHAPSTPTLANPAHNATVTTDSVELRWSDALDPDPGDYVDFYELEVSESPAFPPDQTTGVGGLRQVWYILDGLENGATYHWRVRAVDSFGLSSPWSAAWAFAVDFQGIPPDVELVYPLGGETLSGTVEVLWTARSNDNDVPDEALVIAVEVKGVGAADWTSLAAGLSNTGSWGWNTTSVPDGPAYVLRVTASDGRAIGIAQTAASFSVDNPASPEILYRYPAERWVEVNETESQRFSVICQFSPELSYLWYVDGLLASSGPVFVYATGYEDAGEHSVRVTVSNGLWSDDAVWVMIVRDVNRAPVARIASPLEGAVYTTEDAIAFSGRPSYDLDGDELAYQWYLDDGALSSEVSFAHAYTSPGSYEVRLVVSDGRAESDAWVNLTVLPGYESHRPRARAGDDRRVLQGSWVGFDASASTDPDGDPLSSLWDFGDGTLSAQTRPVHRYDRPGVYVVTLTVSDGSLVDTDQCVVEVVASWNRPPTAEAGGPYDGRAGVPVYLSSLLSSDPDGDDLAVHWTLPNGTSVVGPVVGVVFAEEGAYEVVLTVSDGSLWDRSTAEVRVGPGPPPELEAPASALVSAGGTVGVSIVNPRHVPMNATLRWWLVERGVAIGGESLNASVSLSPLNRTTVELAVPSEASGEELLFIRLEAGGGVANATVLLLVRGIIGPADPPRAWLVPLSASLLALDPMAAAVWARSRRGTASLGGGGAWSAGPGAGGLDRAGLAGRRGGPAGVGAEGGGIASGPRGDERLGAGTAGEGPGGSPRGRRPPRWRRRGRSPAAVLAVAVVLLGLLAAAAAASGDGERSGTQPNLAPTANASGPTHVTVHVPALFDGSASFDPDGDALTYVWDMGDGTALSGPLVSHPFEFEGVYDICLTVHDGSHASSAVMRVQVHRPSPRALSLRAEWGHVGVDAGSTVRIGLNLTNPGMNPLALRFEPGDAAGSWTVVEPAEAILMGGESANITALVRVPAGMPVGDYLLTVNALAVDGGGTEDLLATDGVHVAVYGRSPLRPARVTAPWWGPPSLLLALAAGLGAGAWSMAGRPRPGRREARGAGWGRGSWVGSVALAAGTYLVLSVPGVAVVIPPLAVRLPTDLDTTSLSNAALTKLNGTTLEQETQNLTLETTLTTRPADTGAGGPYNLGVGPDAVHIRARTRFLDRETGEIVPDMGSDREAVVDRSTAAYLEGGEGQYAWPLWPGPEPRDYAFWSEDLGRAVALRFCGETEAFGLRAYAYAIDERRSPVPHNTRQYAAIRETLLRGRTGQERANFEDYLRDVRLFLDVEARFLVDASTGIPLDVSTRASVTAAFPDLMHLPRHLNTTASQVGVLGIVDAREGWTVYNVTYATSLVTEGAVGDAILVRQVTDIVDRDTGAPLPGMRTERLLGVDRFTFAHVPDLGDAERSGQFAFPMGLEPGTYALWSDPLNTTVPARFAGTASHEGFDCYVFVIREEGMEMGLDPKGLGARFAGDVNVTLYLDPLSGLPVDTVTRLDVNATHPLTGTTRVLHLELVPDPATRDEVLKNISLARTALERLSGRDVVMLTLTVWYTADQAAASAARARSAMWAKRALDTALPAASGVAGAALLGIGLVPRRPGRGAGPGREGGSRTEETAEGVDRARGGSAMGR